METHLIWRNRHKSSPHIAPAMTSTDGAQHKQSRMLFRQGLRGLADIRKSEHQCLNRYVPASGEKGTVILSLTLRAFHLQSDCSVQSFVSGFRVLAGGGVSRKAFIPWPNDVRRTQSIIGQVFSLGSLVPITNTHQVTDSCRRLEGKRNNERVHGNDWFIFSPRKRNM